MASGNGRREAYTAGGEATLGSPEIPIADVFIFHLVGAAPEAPRRARRHGSTGVGERTQSRGMARQGTWEALSCPHEIAARGVPGYTQGPGPAAPRLRGGGSAAADTKRAGSVWYRLAKQ